MALPPELSAGRETKGTGSGPDTRDTNASDGENVLRMHRIKGIESAMTAYISKLLRNLAAIAFCCACISPKRPCAGANIPFRTS